MQNSFNWNQIYLEFSPKLLGVCRRYIEDLAIAEDILQDSFLTAIQKEEQLKNSESVYPWLKKIVVNNSLMYLRSNHQRHFTVSDTEILQQIPTTMTKGSQKDYTKYTINFMAPEKEIKYYLPKRRLPEEVFKYLIKHG